MILLSVAAVAVASCSDDEPTGPEPPDPPILESLSDSVLSPGDTLYLTGSKFSTPATGNRVVFNNNLASAVPFFGTAESLGVVVHRWATSGPMRVTTRGVSSAPKLVTILRGVGEPWVIGGAAQFNFKLRADTGTEEYVLVPHSATTTAGNTGYTVRPDTTSTYPAPPAAVSFAGTTSMELEFEARIWREALEHIRQEAGRAKPLRPSGASPAAPPDTTTFRVLNCRCDENPQCNVAQCSSIDSRNFQEITAALRYSGSSGLVYADINQPTGSFTQADYDAFGAQFDNTIFPTDTMAFGPPTDINGDGRVIILFTPQVNELTADGTAGSGFISGFVLPNDLAPNVYGNTSNGAEIFYSMVPDPNGEFGNVFPKNSVTGIIPATLAHELEHMISFGYRFVTLGSGTNFGFVQALWLEEGMAHIAEDLNNFDSSNLGRVNLYMRDPGNVSLMGSDTLEQRGGIYLFLRYLGDRWGEGIYRRILRSTCVGDVCIRGVTGEDFFVTVADYLATLYLSDRGITSDTKYNYSSFDLQRAFDPLPVTTRNVTGGAFGGDVRNVAGDFYRLTGFQQPASVLRVDGSTSGGLRTIAVRVK